MLVPFFYFLLFFFFNDTSTTEIYTLSLHDALPICWLIWAATLASSRPVRPCGVSLLMFHEAVVEDRKSTRLNSSHRCISYAVFCLKKKKITSIVRAYGEIKHKTYVNSRDNDIGKHT